MASQYYKVTAYVGTPHRNAVEVTIPLVGPAGATGATGPSGASTWNEISGKPALFPPSAHDHQPGEVYADAAFVTQSGGSTLRSGIYLRNGTDNSRPVYESPTTGDYIWWDSDLVQWYLTSNTDVNLFYLEESADDFPWETDALWSPIAPQTGNIEVDQATLFDVSDYGSTSVVGLKTPKSGNATSTELVLGNDTRLTNSRTPSSTLAHASSHHTGGTDALTAANIGAAATSHTHAAADITSGTLDVARLPVGTGSTNVIAPTIADAKGDLIVASAADTVARLAVGGTNGHVLTVDSAETLGVKWAASFNPASPGAIGNTTPAAATFSTLTATTSLTLGTSGILTGGTNLIEQVNGTNAQTFRIYRTFTDASNYDRGFLRWSGTTLQIGAERLGSAGIPDLHLLRGSDTFVRLATNGLNVDTVLTVKSTFGPIINGGAIQFQTSNAQFPAILARDAGNTLAMRNGTNAQEYRVYGTYTSDTNFQRLTIKTKAVTLSGLTGASVATTTGLIPDGAVLVGLTTRVSTAITGATGYDIGDGSDADRWGANVAIALNTSSDNTNWTAGTIECFTAAQEVTLTAVGSNFTGGDVVIVAHYLAGEAD
jgi:hypothetical protein